MNALSSCSQRLAQAILIVVVTFLSSFLAAQALARSVSPFPESVLSRFVGQTGKVLYFTVTGNGSSGEVWGSNPYSDGSSLARAAVHAGVLGVGQTGVVRVTITTATSYSGSSAHGVTTTDYNAPYGGYSVAADDGGNNPVLADPGTMWDFRAAAPGSVYLFNVTGTHAGSLWGTNTYTYDSYISAAAVQSGVLGVGQNGSVRVVMTPGLKDYVGSTHNDVSSAPWYVANGVFASSFTVSDPAGTTAIYPYPGMPDNPLPDPGNVGSYVSRIGAALHFRVTASATSGLWGTSIYTWDSHIATAVVHAGLASVGQSVIAKVAILPGQSSYTGSITNGVTSQNWGNYSGSFSVAAPDGAMGTIPRISSALAASGTEGQAFAYTITATQSPTEYYASGLPEGLTLNNGQISGTPKVAGTFHVELLAKNASGITNADLVLSVAASGVTPGTTTSTAAATTTTTTASTTTTTLVQQFQFEMNLLVNGDAESGAGSADGSVVAIPGWNVSGRMTAVKYENGAGYPTATDPGPSNRGLNFFTGGPDGAVAAISQLVDISAAAADIDAGHVSFVLSGFLGGYSSQADHAVLSVDFKNAASSVTGSAAAGPVSNAERNNSSGLLYRETRGPVPPGTRSVEVNLQANRLEGAANDGYGDNLALVLTRSGGSGSATTSTTTSTAATSTTTAAMSTTTGSTTTTTLSGGATVLNVIGGWNLLGNSSSANLDVGLVFGDSAKVTTVWKWVASSAKWAFYTPTIADGGAAYAASKGYDFMTVVAGGEGFWVNAKAAFTASLPSGTAVGSASFQGMAAGWNLIAIGDSKTPSAFNKAIGQTPPNAGEIPINLTTLWTWDATQSNWYFYAPSLEKSGGLASYITSKNYLDFGSKVLDPTTGFWVNKPQ